MWIDQASISFANLGQGPATYFLDDGCLNSVCRVTSQGPAGSIENPSSMPASIDSGYWPQSTMHAATAALDNEPIEWVSLILVMSFFGAHEP